MDQDKIALIFRELNLKKNTYLFKVKIIWEPDYIKLLRPYFSLKLMLSYFVHNGRKFCFKKNRTLTDFHYIVNFFKTF